MFVVDEDRVVQWPVDVPVPMDGGKVEKHRFTAHFKLLDDEEIGKLAAEGNAELLRQVFVGWSDVAVKRQGAPAPETIDFTPERRDRHFLRKLFCVRALAKAYTECIAGVPAKNVGTPPADGPAALPNNQAAAESPKT